MSRSGRVHPLDPPKRGAEAMNAGLLLTRPRDFAPTVGQEAADGR